jgi:hypothetical protein
MEADARMTPEQRRAEAAAVAAAHPLKPHPQGLAGRVADALDDLELLNADPHATPLARRSARGLADALVAALAAEESR